MKLKNHKISKHILIVSAILAVVAGGTIAALFGFSNAISNNLFEASSQSIEQIYEEVAENLKTITESRWNYLEQAGEYMYVSNVSNDKDSAKQYIANLKEKCGFSEFYLLSDSGNYVTLDGGSGYVELGDELFSLIDDGENIVVDGSLPGRENMFFYAIKTKAGTYEDFDYAAVSFGYDLKAISDILSVDAFEGKSDAYLIRANGRVGTSVGTVKADIRNMISFLTQCGVSEEEITKISQNFEKGTADTLRVNVLGTEYYFSYQVAGFNNWILASLTPTDVADKALNTVRSTSLSMMAILGTALILCVALVMSYWVYHSTKSRKKLTKEREIIFEAASTHMDEIFMLYDLSAKHALYVSPNIERMLGISPEDIYQSDGAFDKCANGAIHRELLDQIKPGDSVYRELDMKNVKNGEMRPYSLEIYRQDDKNPDLFVVTLADNTQERKIRQEIIEAANAARSANEAKSTFLSSMSHDIRTPMNAVIGFTTLLDANAENPDKVHEYSHKILDSSNHLLGLINDILDISKIESGKTILSLEETSLLELVNETSDMIRPLYEAKKQSFNLHVSSIEKENVFVDKIRLTQVLQNLLSNAIKYTPNGGEINFYAEKLDYNEKNELAKYRFIVEDNGIGMSKEFQEKAFEPFSREMSSTVNKIQGTGLGLAITKNLIDLMGGSISLTSEPGKGSKFEVLFTLHIADSVKTEKEKIDVPAEFDMNGLHILAAEDNVLNAEILVDLLKMEGVDVNIAENGLEAVKKFEESTPGTYNLVLMDVQMPEMNGYEATKAIRASKHQEGKTIPIIAMTANAFPEDIQMAMQSGMNAYLTKPINMDNLKATIEKTLGGGIGFWSTKSNQ